MQLEIVQAQDLQDGDFVRSDKGLIHKIEDTFRDAESEYVVFWTIQQDDGSRHEFALHPHNTIQKVIKL